jgi:hypothetical protein
MKLHSISKNILCACLLTIVFGCSKDDNGSATLPSNPDVPTPGVISATAGFNVKPNPPKGTRYYMHKEGDFSESCTVPSTATAYADKDIMCLLEVEELEGVFHGLDMVLNVPPSMCTYVEYYSYFYFGLEPGVGPTAATVRFDKDGQYVSGALTGPGGQIDAGGKVLCNYDYQALDGGPNCCTGKYDLTTITNFGSVDPDFPVTTITQANIPWGGLPGNCVAGAGSTQPRFKADNMPLATIYFKPNGFSESFTTGGDSLQKGVGSKHFANYFSGVPPAAFNIGQTYEANPYYSWTCLDSAHEVKYRIRVMAREWNEMSEFNLKEAGDPDTGGVEPDWGSGINDWGDWLDNVLSGNNFPGMPAQ